MLLFNKPHLDFTLKRLGQEAFGPKASEVPLRCQMKGGQGFNSSSNVLNPTILSILTFTKQTKKILKRLGLPRIPITHPLFVDDNRLPVTANFFFTCELPTMSQPVPGQSLSRHDEWHPAQQDQFTAQHNHK